MIRKDKKKIKKRNILKKIFWKRIFKIYKKGPVGGVVYLELFAESRRTKNIEKACHSDIPENFRYRFPRFLKSIFEGKIGKSKWIFPILFFHFRSPLDARKKTRGREWSRLGRTNVFLINWKVETHITRHYHCFSTLFVNLNDLSFWLPPTPCSISLIQQELSLENKNVFSPRFFFLPARTKIRDESGIMQTLKNKNLGEG